MLARNLEGEKTGAKSQLKNAPRGQPHTKIFCTRFFGRFWISSRRRRKKNFKGNLIGLVTGRTLWDVFPSYQSIRQRLWANLSNSPAGGLTKENLIGGDNEIYVEVKKINRLHVRLLSFSVPRLSNSPLNRLWNFCLIDGRKERATQRPTNAFYTFLHYDPLETLRPDTFSFTFEYCPNKNETSGRKTAGKSPHGTKPAISPSVQVERRTIVFPSEPQTDGIVFTAVTKSAASTLYKNVPFNITKLFYKNEKQRRIGRPLRSNGLKL